MTIHELYESLSPIGYFALIIAVLFLIGLFLGWCLWWWGSRKWAQTEPLLESAKQEVDQLRTENQTLATELAEQEKKAQEEAQETLSKTPVLAEMPNGAFDGMIKLPAVEGDAIDWESVDGIDPSVAAEFNRLGIKNIEQIESLSPEDKQRLSARLTTDDKPWDWGQLANWKTAVLAAGAAAVASKSGKPDDMINGSPEGIEPGELQLPDNDSPKVDWSRVAGIGPKLASDMEAAGVKNVEQLESLSPVERRVLEAKMAAKGHRWDWSWLHDWKTSATASAGIASQLTPGVTSYHRIEPGANSGSESWYASSALSGSTPLQEPPHLLSGLPTTSDSGFGSISGGSASTSNPQAIQLTLPPSSSPKTDWTNVDGVSPELAVELDAMGVQNIDQLENLSSDDRSKLQSHLSTKGHDWDWSWLENWKSGLAVAGATIAGATALKQTDNSSDDDSDRQSTSPNESVANSSGWSLPTHASVEPKLTTNDPAFSFDLSPPTGPAIDWNRVDGVSPELASELGSLGITSLDQLENLSPAERRRLETHLESKGHRWYWSWLADWKRSMTPTESSQATSLQESSADEVASPNASLGAVPTGSGFYDGETTVTGFATGTGGRTAPASGSSREKTSGDGMPFFELKSTPFKDDLTLLDGIDGPQAIELHKMGIQNFDQIHDLSAEDRMRLQNWFRQRGWYLDMDQWRIASEGNTLNPTIEDIQRKAFEIYQFRDGHGLGGGERTDWEQAEWELRGNPSFGYGVPHHVDDFAICATGITPEARDELYRMGLYNFGQVAALDQDARRLLTRWFAGPRFGVDLTMAFGWLSSLKSVPQDREYGHVFAIRPDHIDDLSDIKGIGPATERDLNRIGIYQFSQIANWSDENIQAISETLELSDRIHEDHWINQAKRMLDTSTDEDDGDEVLSRIRAKSASLDFDRIGRVHADDRDNLKEIKGIGPYIEKKLNALGIYTFRQIANFTFEDENKVNEAIEFFPGRVKRDEWVRQAQQRTTA